MYDDELLMIVNVVTMNMMKLHRLILIVNRVAMLDDLNTYTKHYVFYIKSVVVAKSKVYHKCVLINHNY